mmetsp:Transcript_36651/g.84319  ORF Transcript_36651/g.84319 Transcript_36651/m.84319 type:complete len:552 (-) Transcript_36651:67-1722(-)
MEAGIEAGASAPQKRKAGGPAPDEAAMKRRACLGREDIAETVPTPCRSPGPKGREPTCPERSNNVPCLSKLPKASLRERLERRVGSYEELRHPEAPCSQTQSYASSSSPAAASKPPAEPLEKQHSAMSIKELKTLLSAEDIDCTGCVEKGDLLALLQRFEKLQGRSLEELQDACAAAGGGRPPSASACARFLLTVQPSKARHLGQAGSRTAPEVCRRMSPPRVPQPGGGGSSSSRAAFVADASAGEASRTAGRILALRQASFRSASDWAFAVLELRAGTADVAAVQRSFRQLMRSLHPDKAGDAADVSEAVDCARRARALCERALSKEQVPAPPRALGVAVLCAYPGQRSFELTWQPPRQSECAPVRRYVVAVYDPGYGQPLTVASLEPDYNEELQRYVSLEDLTRYVLSEKELQKMPKVWTQASITVHIAAANEAGQSTWAILQVPLAAGSAARRCLAAPSIHPTSSTPAQPRAQPPSAGRTKPDAWSAPDASQAMRGFMTELQRRSGSASLTTWLRTQPKQILANYLRKVGMPTTGSKEELASRVTLVV